ncbi:MAG TPA: folate-binding protein YgfZ, partial [Candidatus Thioglobus sp.]|nr:folate-binding protein YgfZ [Candidatus Thioglobus sp.]
SSIQLNAYCQHQGKMLALFWVMRSNDDFLLSFPLDLLEIIKSRLQMFVIMSDVTIDDVTDDYLQIGVIDENQNNAFTINDKLSLIIANPNDLEKFSMSSKDTWDKACIDSSLPEIYLLTSEKMVPQMLNLDIDEIGVNFSKGCFPGQEVVARLHYLGVAKRRLFAFESDSEINVGDTLFCSTSKSAKARGARYKASGMVVSKVKYKTQFYCLATLEVASKDEKVTLNNEQGPILKRIKNE